MLKYAHLVSLTGLTIRLFAQQYEHLDKLKMNLEQQIRERHFLEETKDQSECHDFVRIDHPLRRSPSPGRRAPRSQSPQTSRRTIPAHPGASLASNSLRHPVTPSATPRDLTSPRKVLLPTITRCSVCMRATCICVPCSSVSKKG